jgi:hypothetical protein
MNATIQQLFTTRGIRANRRTHQNLLSANCCIFLRSLSISHILLRSGTVNPREQADAVDFLQQVQRMSGKSAAVNHEHLQQKKKKQRTLEIRRVPNPPQTFVRLPFLFPVEVRCSQRIRKSVGAFVTTGYIDLQEEGEITGGKGISS